MRKTSLRATDGCFCPSFINSTAQGERCFHAHRELTSISTEQGHFSLSKHCCHCYIGKITITDHLHLPAAHTDMIMNSLYGDSESCLMVCLMTAGCIDSLHWHWLIVLYMATAQIEEGSISILLSIFLPVSVTNREHYQGRLLIYFSSKDSLYIVLNLLNVELSVPNVQSDLMLVVCSSPTKIFLTFCVIKYKP